MTTEYPYYAVKDAAGNINHTTIKMRPDWAQEELIGQDKALALQGLRTSIPSWEHYEAEGYSVIRVAIVEEPKP